MISTKVIVALSLTGLGAGVTAGSALLANAHRFAPVTLEPEVRLKPEPPKRAEPTPAPERNAVVTLDPVTVVGELPARPVRKVAAPPRQLVPCSKWRDVTSGPTGHGVRELCWSDAD